MSCPTSPSSAWPESPEYSFGVEATGRRIPTAGEIESGDVNQASTTELTADFRFSEGWIGFTWSYPVSPTLGVGVTTYLAGRGQSRRVEVNLSTVDSNDVGGSLRLVDDASYWIVAWLGKQHKS